MWEPKQLFHPFDAIRDKNRDSFSGRENDFCKALEHLGATGTALAVCGQRGIGKTSFAWQLKSILAEGSIKRTPQRSSGRLKSFRIPAFTPFWIECNPYTKNLGDVLLTLLQIGTGVNYTLFDGFPECFSDRSFIENIERTAKIGPVGSKVTKRMRGLNRSVKALAADQQVAARAHRLFSEALSKIKKSKKPEPLIFIDEFDTLQDRSGTGQFIKTCSDARFVIVGIAETARSIVGEHPSVDRKLKEVYLDELSQADVYGLLDIVEGISRKQKRRVVFSQEYRALTHELSNGFPEVIQAIGYESMLKLRDLSRQTKALLTADTAVFEAAVGAIYGPKGEKRSHLTDIRKAVGKDRNRETILTTIARKDLGWIPEHEIKDDLTTSQLNGYESNLDALIKAGILERDESDERIRFVSVATKLVIEQACATGIKLTQGK